MRKREVREPRDLCSVGPIRGTRAHDLLQHQRGQPHLPQHRGLDDSSEARMRRHPGSADLIFCDWLPPPAERIGQPVRKRLRR
jgi:hypothetical protein